MTDDTNSRCQNPPADPCKPPQEPNNPQDPKPDCPPLDAGPKTPELPTLPECPEPCCCPSKPGSTGTCLDDLIDEQSKQVSEGDTAKTFKAELEEILKKAKAAMRDYPRKKYDELRAQWKAQDAQIVELARNVVCAVPCWWCVIECEICPLLYAIRNTELRLNGTGQLSDKVFSLLDLQYWQQRNRDAKEDVFNRIKVVLQAWEKPAATLDKILLDNTKIIRETPTTLGSEQPKALYDVFLKLIPLHLAIAPRDGTKSNIPADYTKFCSCDTGKPDICCGPDTGKWTVRQRLIEQQPYIIDPDKFFDVICCLAKERYLPAKELLAKAKADLLKTEADIKRARDDLAQKAGSVFTDFKGNVAHPIDCCKNYKRKGPDGKCCPETPSDPPPATPYTVR